MRDLNQLSHTLPPLHEVDFSWEGFQWMALHDKEKSVISFVRRAKNPMDYIVCIFNFTPTPHHGYRIGVPTPAPLEIVLNTDAETYGGSGMGDPAVIWPGVIPWEGQPCSAALTLPPLAALYLAPWPVGD